MNTGTRYWGLLALPLPVWGFVSSLEPWLQALVVIVGIPVLSISQRANPEVSPKQAKGDEEVWNRAGF